MNIAWPIYRRLAAAFPHEFKLAFGNEMMQTGEDTIAHIAKRHGILGLVRLIADMLLRLPIEYLNEMRRDLPYAARTLTRSPGYAAVGIISLGLGIGLTTNVYSSGWALLTRALPGVDHPDQLVTAMNPASNPYVEHYREQKNLFAGVAAVMNHVEFNVAFEARSGKPEHVYGQLVPAGLFFRPRHGRAKRPAPQRRS